MHSEPCARQFTCDHEWDTTTELADDDGNPVDAECMECGAISV